MPAKKKATFRPGPKKSGSKSVSTKAPKTYKPSLPLGRESKRLQVLALGSSDEKFMSFVEAHLALEYAEKIISAIDQPLMVLDENLKIISANRFLYDTFKVKPKEIKGKLFYKLGNGEWDIPELKKLLNKPPITGTPVRDFEIKHSIPTVGQRTLHLTARTIYTQAEKARFVLLGIKDVTELKKAEESADKLASFPQMNPMPVLEIDPSGKLLYMNPAAKKLLPDLLSSGLEHPYLKGVLSVIAELRAGKEKWIQREVRVNENWYAQMIFAVEGGSRIRIYAVNITERKEAEKELEKLNRTLRALSHSNHALMHAQEESAYLQDVCRIIIDECGHSLVWIGFAERDEAKTVRPVAQAGFEEGYLKTLDITWADTERGRGPTGTAIRTGKPALCRNMLTDPKFKPWRKEALKRGYASSVVLPIIMNRETFGAISIYSKEPDGFSEDEVKLLGELADDLAFGIMSIRLRNALKEAKDNLEVRVKERTVELERARVDMEAERQRLYAVLETLPAYVVLLSEDYHVPFANRFFRERFGESYGKRCFEYLFHRTEPCENCETYKVLKTNAPHHWEWTGPDGRNYDIYDYPFKDNDGSNLILEMGIDITERKTAEGELRRHKEHLEELVRERTADLEIRNAQLAAEIAERRKAEESLARIKEEWERTFRSVPDLIAILDNQHRIVRVNQAMAQRLGTAPEKCIGLNCFKCVHGTTEPPAFCPHARTLRDGKEHVEEIHEERLGGDFLVSTTPMFDESGKMVGSVHVARDITERKKIEQALRESEEKYRTIVETANEGIWVVDADRKTTYVNGRMAEILGYRPEEMLGKSGLDFVDQADRRLSDEAFEKRKRGTRETYEFKLIRKGGQPLWTLVNAVPLFDKSGKFLGTMSMLTDITERKKAEDALRETTDYLENLFNYANAPIICWDTKFKITRFNHAFEHLTDYKAEEVIGKDLSTLFPAGSKEESLGKIRKTLSGEHWEVVEIPILRKNGEVRLALWNSANVYAEDGKTIIATIAQGQDITERKKGEERILREKEFLESLVDSLPGVFYTIDSNARMLVVNNRFSQVTGYSADEILRMTAMDLFSEKDKSLIAERIKEVFEKGISDAEASFLTKDGRSIPYYFTGARIIRDGSPLLIGMGIDMTERKKVEDVLRETTNYLENLINYANAPIICWDTKFKITRFNHAFEHLTDYKADEVIGKDLSILFPSDNKEESLGKIRRTLGGEYWEVVEIPILRKNGEVRIALWNSANVYDEDGKTIIATIAQGQDITQRKKAEDALRETTDYLENLFDYANAPIICWDTKFKITRFNHAFEHLTDYKADEVIGRDLGILFPEKTKEESLSKISRTLSGEYWEVVEIPILRRDGQVRIALWNSANVYAEDGKTIIATIAQGQDITERKKAEDELRKLTAELQEERDILDIIKENTSAHLAYLDRNFNFVRVNSTYAKGSGHSAEELIGKNHFDLFPSKENEVIFKQVRDTGKPAEFKAKPFLFADRPEKGVTYWDWTLIPVKDTSGQVQGLVLSLIDITEIKKTEEAIRALNDTLRTQAAELAAANKELEAFSYSVSHDLRAPLRNIDGFSQALLEDYVDKLDQKGQNYLKRVRAATQRMGQLIDDLLNLSVMVRKEMRREEVDLSRQARAVAEELKNTAPERKVEIKIQDNLRASGDPLLLRQLLENLLGNAWKFTSKNPVSEIEFGSIEKDGNKTFFIKDNGVGFDMKYVNKMFIPFQRLHSFEEFTGNGIGLAIVKRVIDRHGGRIWAEGGVDKGATFYFTLE